MTPGSDRAISAADAAEAVVFVRGTGRCGSRTLVRWLGEHPGLARVPVNETLPEGLIDWSTACLPEDTSEEVLAAACRAYFSTYARALAGRPGRLLQKSTMHAHLLDTLLRFWPQARVIYLVRHPIGVVQSMINIDIHEFKGRYGYQATVANSLLRWYTDVDAYLRSEAFGHRATLQVRFEDLMHDPAGTLAEIDRFLELAPDQRPRRPTTPVHEAGPDAYADRFVLHPRERRWIIDATAEIVGRLGYNPLGWSDDAAVAVPVQPDRHAPRRLHGIPPSLDGAELVRRALARAAAQGFRRAALFGAGYLARLVCPRLGPCAAQIACLCDDDSLRVGRRLAGLPICRPEHAAGQGAEVAVPLTLVHQATLLERWRRVSDLPIIPLWDEAEAPRSPVGAGISTGALR